MKILGLSCFYHDSAAALVVDGELVAAASEERFSRIKHDPELPMGAVQFCLNKANSNIKDIDFIVFYDKPMTKFDRIIIGYMASPFVSFRPFIQAMPLWLRRKLWMEHIFHEELGFEGETLYLPHHISHAAGAYYSSPFDEAALLTIDGVGEWATAAWGVAKSSDLRLSAQMNYPHSVGLLYSAFTQFLGFRVNSAEYKVMGLAPYGECEYVDLIKKKLVRIHQDGSIHLNLDNFAFHRGLTMVDDRFEHLFGIKKRLPDEELEPIHKNIAASIQAVTEEIVLKMACHVREKTGQKNLCLSGGVALNCRANGRLLKDGIFDQIHIQPAAGDSGGALGAALYLWHKITKKEKKPQSFFGLGPSYSHDEITRFLSKHQIPRTEDDPQRMAATVAHEIERGQIVGIFQGSMEFGPRALGFRSIVADPRDDSMKDRINRAVKFREGFRPFAPSVLAESAAKFFDISVESPYMLFNFGVLPQARSMIPAVTHFDFSSRIQTVRHEDNPFFYQLLDEFGKLTGMPVLLNTSFNLRGWPIVNRPDEAMATFCSGGIDILVIGNYLIDKKQLAPQLIEQFRIARAED